MKTTTKSATVLFGLALLSTSVFATGKSKTDTVKNAISAIVTFSASTAGVDLTIDNATAGDDTLVISDAAGNVVLSDRFTADTSKIQKNYLLTDMAAGNYTVAVSINDKVTATTITLNSEETDQTYYSVQ